MNELKNLADALLKYETIDAEDVKRIVEGKEPLVASQTKEIPITITIIPGQDNGRVGGRITTPTPHPFKI